jgi:hypothetical protein
MSRSVLEERVILTAGGGVPDGGLDGVELAFSSIRQNAESRPGYLISSPVKYMSSIGELGPLSDCLGAPFRLASVYCPSGPHSLLGRFGSPPLVLVRACRLLTSALHSHRQQHNQQL